MPDLSPFLVTGTCTLWLSEHHGCKAGRQPVPQHRLTPGLMFDLGRQFQSLLSVHNQPILMTRRWSGQWDPGAIASLKPVIARCSRKQIKAVLGHVGGITCSTTSACWRNFLAMARELDPSTVKPLLPHRWLLGR